MTRWKKDETEFTVSLFIDKSRGSMCIVPKPIVEKLGSPEKIRFVIRGKNIIVLKVHWSKLGGFPTDGKFG